MSAPEYISVWHVAWYDSFEKIACVECFESYDEAIDYLNGWSLQNLFVSVSGPHQQRVA
jgi:hypothetical protein